MTARVPAPEVAELLRRVDGMGARPHPGLGLPPASIAVAGFDPLRDEGLAYVHRLGAQVREWPDMIHGFLWMAGELPQAAEPVTWVAGECATAGREVAT